MLVETQAQSYDPFLIYSKMESNDVINMPLSNTNVEVNKSNTTSIPTKISLANIQNWLHFEDGVLKTSIKINGKTKLNLLLTKSNILDEQFKLSTLQDGKLTPFTLQKSVHFKGIVEGQSNSIVCMSIYLDEVFGTILMEDGVNYSIRTISKDNKFIHTILTNETEAKTAENFEGCQTDDYRHFIDDKTISSTRSKDNCKIVKLSLHTDYALYQKMELSKDKVSNYIMSVFNNVQAIYRKEDIQIAIAELVIHASDDKMPHTSALEDLEFFRTSYPSYSGNAMILVSGFSRNGNPALGGLAYVNSLCMKNYSYAFTNVQGSFSTFPTFSWDVFVCAHELGHILGSRHTHACVWGPNKNQAIDNCAKQEGSCAAGPTPIKGTLMSYCYNTGKPGVDLTLGLGLEPGNLIRAKINSSTCLSSYIPTQKLVTTANQHIRANVECHDGIYTHYYYDNNTISQSDDILLLSINRKAQDIGNILDGSLTIIQHTTSKYGTNQAQLITAAYVPIGQNFISANKYWEIISTKQPAKEVQVKYSYSDSDLADIRSKYSDANTTNLLMYSLAAPANPNPESNHERSTYASFNAFQYSSTLAPNKYTYTKEPNGTNTVEFSTIKLNGLGLGIFSNSNTTSSAEFNLTYFKSRQFGIYRIIEWQTSLEKNSKYFVVEKSLDGIKFDSIGNVKAAVNSTSLKSYSINNYNSTSSKNIFYRLRMVDQNGMSQYSVVISSLNSYTSTNRLNIYPNPTPTNELTLEYNSSAASSVNIQAIDVNGNTIKSEIKTLIVGKNFINYDVSSLKDGFYYLNIISTNESFRQKFSINRNN